MVARKTTVIEPIIENELSLNQLQNNETGFSDDEEDINNVLAELGGESDAKINVYKIVTGKPLAFVGSFSASSFTIEAIQQTYGAGEYTVHVRAFGKLKTRRNISIAEPIQNHMQLPVPQLNENKIVETMANGFQQMSAMFMEGLKQLAHNQPQPKTTTELLQELMLMKQVMGTGGNSSNDLDQFMKGLEFAKQITPREGEPSGSEILMKGIETFAPILQSMKENQVNIQPGQIPAYAPQNIQPIQPEQNIQQPENIAPNQSNESSNMSLQESMYLNLLVQNAKADNDPVTYANMAIDILGVEKALEYVNHPDYLKILIEKKPEAEPYKTWFEEFKQTVNELAKETLTVDPANGNNSNQTIIQPETGANEVSNNKL